ncbi:MAG: TraR/DksA family transcriptional regulator [Victivallales bacterium]|jgi:DnaK suppressor protein|nr:TraR/DksA family transcriptional regulator [Victivallales bacterium]
MGKKKKNLVFEGKDKEYYDALMHARDVVTNQMQYHAEDALDCSNADKRGVTTHMADVSSDNSRREMELRMLTEEGNVLQLIEDALQRLTDGEYGICQECGERISEGRLNIRPYAVFCVQCKSKHESAR